jgi:hypothetical protein
VRRGEALEFLVGGEQVEIGPLRDALAAVDGLGEGADVSGEGLIAVGQGPPSSAYVGSSSASVPESAIAASPVVCPDCMAVALLGSGGLCSGP